MTERYLDVNGVPGLDDGVKIPRTFVNGRWITRYDVDRFFENAYPISKQRFDEMVAQQSGREHKPVLPETPGSAKIARVKRSSGTDEGNR